MARDDSAGRGERDPAREKQLSYESDVVDAWGESQKAFRKSWPRKKARLQRAYRRGWTTALSTADEEGIDSVAIRRKSHRKWSGPRLGEWRANRDERARRLEAEPRKSEQARERRRERRRSR